MGEKSVVISLIKLLRE